MFRQRPARQGDADRAGAALRRDGSGTDPRKISALGISAGCLVHVAAAALGLSTLMLAVPLAYDVVRYAGAAYLVWLGVRALMSRSGALAVQEMSAVSHWAIFRQGMVTNALNPKVALFFLAFLPQFTDASRGPLALQFVFWASSSSPTAW